MVAGRGGIIGDVVEHVVTKADENVQDCHHNCATAARLPLKLQESNGAHAPIAVLTHQ